MKVGQKVQLKILKLPEQLYTIMYIGPFSVKLQSESGSIYTVQKRKVRYQLYGPQKDNWDRATSSIDAISVPMGGQPDNKK